MGQKVSICSTQRRPSNIDSNLDFELDTQDQARLSTNQRTEEGDSFKNRQKGIQTKKTIQSRIQGRSRGSKSKSALTSKAASREKDLKNQMLNTSQSGYHKTMESMNQSHDESTKKRGLEDFDKDLDQIEILKMQKAMKIRITWNYGGKEVFIVGSFTNWDYMIKLHEGIFEGTPVFEISMYVKAGLYHYYFVVDGQVRFAPDQPSTIGKSQQIVNFINVDNYMIEKAGEAREDQRKVKNLAQCVASENSWRLSENFHQNCKERSQFDLHFSNRNLEYSFDMKSCFGGNLDESGKLELGCEACLIKERSGRASLDLNDPCLAHGKLELNRHLHFFPSSSYLESHDLGKLVATQVQVQ